MHYYFPSKQELFAEALRYSVKLAYDRQSAELVELDDPVERLRTLIRVQLPTDELSRADWSIWLQTWVSVMLTGDQQDGHSNSYRRWWLTVREAIKAGQATGAFVDESADELTDALTAFVDGLGIRVLSRMLSPERTVEYVDQFIHRVLLVERKNP